MFHWPVRTTPVTSGQRTERTDKGEKKESDNYYTCVCFARK